MQLGAGQKCASHVLFHSWVLPVLSSMASFSCAAEQTDVLGLDVSPFLFRFQYEHDIDDFPVLYPRCYQCSLMLNTSLTDITVRAESDITGFPVAVSLD